MASDEIVRVAASALLGFTDDMRYDTRDQAKAVIAAVEPLIKAEALREAADSLEWVKPEVCPCVSPESCCGDAAHCDAMQPSVRVVGQEWLLERAARIARGDHDG